MREAGAAAVEMAFTVVLLLWLVFGIVDVGRAIFTDIGLKEATQAGAHHLAFTENATATSAEAVAIASTNQPTLHPGQHLTFTCTPITRNGEPFGTVSVTATYELTLITPLVGSAFGGTMTLGEQAEAERYFPCPGP